MRAILPLPAAATAAALGLLFCGPGAAARGQTPPDGAGRPASRPAAASPAPVTARRTGPLAPLVATCPPGRRVLGGGYEVPGRDLEQSVGASRPTADGRGWSVTADAVNPALLRRLELVEQQQDAVEAARTPRKRAAAERELAQARKAADRLPQRAPVRGTVYAVCG
ncbi:hypothetical protein ACFV3R_07540 [Streptomyces sp. NPDC059740]|uniref:hypothetical protein n=1 Tax=Streptomyces sp. NPDC059740 TaxID=3346926 RepID=UPI00364F97AF